MEITEKKREETGIKEKEPAGNSSRTMLITATSVLALSVFIIFLFLINKAEWEQKLREAQGAPKTEVLQPVADNSQPAEIPVAQPASSENNEDSLRTAFFVNNTYDPKVRNNFRMYGLFKDRTDTLTTAEVAARFNIANEKSVKISEANGERWFIVPVKAVHFVKEGETAHNIARRYYRDGSKARLILNFNGQLKAGTMVFVPFN